MDTGFVGLGITGRPMALNLRKVGHNLLIPEGSKLTSEVRGVTEVLADVGAVSASSEFVILMMPDCAAWGAAELDHCALVRATGGTSQL
jgi:2-hydroxy-3-oxopropionate reductase